MRSLWRLIALNPFDTGLRWAYAEQRFGDEPPYEKVAESYGPALDWDLSAMLNLAHLAGEKSPERRLTRACGLEGDECSGLAWFLADVGEEVEAADAYRRFWHGGLDRVRVSNSVSWLVEYDRKHNHIDEAFEVARDAADTYSGSGLETLARLQEDTGDRASAAKAHNRRVPSFLRAGN